MLALLEMPRQLYQRLIADLARVGEGVKESGAFLLGDITSRRCARSYLLYSELAPETARAHQYVALTGTDMAVAWARCRELGLQVVADIHTHPGTPQQSASDRAHPIVSIAGHVALIAPNYALGDPQPDELGVHRFLGNGRWESYLGRDAQLRVQLTEGLS